MITVPKPEVLRDALASIEANLAHWDQDHWINLNGPVPEGETCGTTACLAGWIGLNAGLTVEQVSARSVGIQDFALTALGFEMGEEVPCVCDDHCDIVFQERSPEALKFSEIFWITSSDGGHDEDGYVGDLAFTEEAFLAFKAKIAELTGLEL